MKKNNKKEPNWEEINFKEIEAEVEAEDVNPQKKKRSGAYAKNKGNAYERQIVKELKDLIKQASSMVPPQMK